MAEADIAGVRPRPRFAREVETPVMRLPEGKAIGAVLAVETIASGDIFLLHQPDAQGLSPGSEDSARWLAPVVRLTRDGDFVSAWGGPDSLPAVDGVSQWPAGLEGLNFDDEGNIWIFGYRAGDNAVLKYAQDGSLLLRIGERGKVGDDSDTRYLDRPTAAWHDVAHREVYVSDGYGNHRVIIFDSDSGAYKRMFGAYGRDPASLAPGEGYANPVHDVALGPNGRLYVADRTNSRVQEFELIPGGQRFVREVKVAPGTNVFNTGSAWDLGFAPGGDYMYVADGPNFRIWTVDLDSFTVLGSTTVHDEHENDDNLPIHFSLVHRFAVEPSGDLLLACVNRGLKRLRFDGIR